MLFFPCVTLWPSSLPVEVVYLQSGFSCGAPVGWPPLLFSLFEVCLTTFGTTPKAFFCGICYLPQSFLTFFPDHIARPVFSSPSPAFGKTVYLASFGRTQGSLNVLSSPLGRTPYTRPSYRHRAFFSKQDRSDAPHRFFCAARFPRPSFPVDCASAEGVFFP